MVYKNIHKAKFIDRPNRFIANILVDGKMEVCHVKNTGRCKELLIPGAEVFVQKFEGGIRKTKFDLISVVKNDRLVNIDSQVPNKVFHQFLLKGDFLEDITFIKPEARYKNSRFDFYVETQRDKIFIEVKGVTLEEDGTALFPDAPTQRGVKHLRELADCVNEGFIAYVVFVIQMKNVECFMPNVRTHPEFAQGLAQASDRGVNILAYDCNVGEDFIEISEKVEAVINDLPI